MSIPDQLRLTHDNSAVQRLVHRVRVVGQWDKRVGELGGVNVSVARIYGLRWGELLPD